ncbi:MAG: PAS domain S-box protein [Desulfobulbaceae bacterium]|nr:PAS domain S-box protein [Desulfobulbaceae bacterium]
MNTIASPESKIYTQYSEHLSLLDNIPDALLLVDSKGLVVYSNPHIEKIFGYSSEELQGSSIECLVPEHSQQKYFKQTEHNKKTPKLHKISVNDLRGRHKNGEELHIEVSLSPYLIGNKTYSIAVIRDASDHYWEQIHLKDREERLRVLIDSTRAIPWSADANTWEITYVGSQTLDILGYPVEHWYKKDFWINHIHPDDRDSVIQTCHEKMCINSNFELEYRMIKSDGGVIWFHDAVNVEYKNSKPLLLRGFLIDITERIKKNEQLYALQQELTHIARVSAAGELTASIAHELNQPLAAIMSNVQAAQNFLGREVPDIEEVKGALEDVIKDNQRAGEIINRLRKMLINGEPVKVSLNIIELIEEVINLVRNDALNKGVSILFEKPRSSIPRIKGDKIQIQQVILNIILNAFDSMMEKTSGVRRLIIKVTCNDVDGVIASFLDNGIGLGQHDNSGHIYDAFYTTKKKGMGMGLTICKTIIDSHGGKLWGTQNKNGEGAVFHFTLPCTG